MLPKRTILVVDDQAEARRLLHHGFRRHYRVVEAADAEQAMAALASGPVDLVLLDLHLPPDRDSPREGIRIHRGIRERYPGLPVVVVTSDDDPRTRSELWGEGVSDFVPKPVDMDVLARAVRRALERNPGRIPGKP